MYIKRTIEAELKPRNFPKVLIMEGARTAGKTSVARHLIENGQYERYVDAADATVRQRALVDLPGWLAALPSATIIDEAQLLPDLPIYLKSLVDVVDSPSHFLLTGSASIGRHGLGGSDPLTGRVERWRLHPFTAAELTGNAARLPYLIDNLFSAPPRKEATLEIPKVDISLPNIVLAGGFPALALGTHDGNYRNRWVRDTVVGLLTDDVLPGEKFDSASALRVLDACLRSTGEILNIAALATRLDLNPRTVDRYLDVLSRRFLLHFLPNFATSPHRQTRARSKIHAVDTAFAAESISRANPHAIETAEVVGHLTETYVINQFIAAIQHSRLRPEAFYWRTSKGDAEVDLVLVNGAGKAVAIEVKSSSSVGREDARGIFAFEKIHELHAGFVVYTGSDLVRFSEKVWGLPFTALSNLPEW